MQQMNIAKLKLKSMICVAMTVSLMACTSKIPEPVITPVVEEKQQPIITPEHLWQQHQRALSKIVSFKANGSLAYFSNKTKHYARFFFNQISSTHYQLKLTTPVGGTVMELMVKPNFVELTDRNGEKYQGTDVEDLLLELTNMNIPLKSIHNWLLGLSNNPVQDKINQDGYLKEAEFSQNSEMWQLNIQSYNTKEAIALPAQLQLTHKDDVIRLRINNWVLE
ncbi:lipoprotein insertase outer membrane protein LolB [Utexia brackfieldae]|uniref:lipoprotein insertase outer membrane protein LolB n=1 Tax=Utexia brackfieldae TaxID=3074108 RepID=UPI00370CFE6A